MEGFTVFFGLVIGLFSCQNTCVTFMYFVGLILVRFGIHTLDVTYGYQIVIMLDCFLNELLKDCKGTIFFNVKVLKCLGRSISGLQ